MPFATLAASVRATYTGYWSPYALLFAIFMAFIGLVLVTVLLIYALMGRISPRPARHGEFGFDEEEGNEDEAAPSMDVALKRSQKTALRKAQQEQEKAAPQKPRRKTGWQYLVGAIACSPVSIAVFAWADNPLGQMRSLTFGAVVNALLLALQIFLTVRFALCQRRLPR